MYSRLKARPLPSIPRATRRLGNIGKHRGNVESGVYSSIRSETKVKCLDDEKNGVTNGNVPGCVFYTNIHMLKKKHANEFVHEDKTLHKVDSESSESNDVHYITPVGENADIRTSHYQNVGGGERCVKDVQSEDICKSSVTQGKVMGKPVSVNKQTHSDSTNNGISVVENITGTKALQKQVTATESEYVEPNDTALYANTVVHGICNDSNNNGHSKEPVKKISSGDNDETYHNTLNLKKLQLINVDSKGYAEMNAAPNETGTDNGKNDIGKDTTITSETVIGCVDNKGLGTLFPDLIQYGFDDEIVTKPKVRRYVKANKVTNDTDA